jgi:hypothetical protein
VHAGRASKLRVDLADLGLELARRDTGARAAIALAGLYDGERTIAIGLGGLGVVRPSAIAQVLRSAAHLLGSWGPEARVEIRGLRPSARRVVLAAVEAQRDLTVTALARRAVVVAPAGDDWLRAHAAYAGLTANRRRMMLLASRDGEHCVWCTKPLTYRCPDATVDHIVCRSRGGSNSLENLVLACARCNHRRADALAETWLENRLASGIEVDTVAARAAIRRAERDFQQRRRRFLLAVQAEAA